MNWCHTHQERVFRGVEGSSLSGRLHLCNSVRLNKQVIGGFLYSRKVLETQASLRLPCVGEERVKVVGRVCQGLESEPSGEESRTQGWWYTQSHQEEQLLPS